LSVLLAESTSAGLPWGGFFSLADLDGITVQFFHKWPALPKKNI
jgi:hypothetical protein